MTTLSVAWTTGSDRSPPGGLTAPMTLRAPGRRSRPRAMTRAGPLVELGDAAGEVGGIALLARHLLHPAGDLAQGLGPAAGRVGHQGHGVAHVPEVFGDGHARVDGGLAGRDGHVRRIGDDDGPLEERPPRRRVLELGEAQEQVGDLVAALPAGDEDDDLGVRPFGQLVLDDGLAGAEGPGDAGRPALGEREEHVDDPLSRDERLFRHDALGHGPLAPDGPGLEHRKLFRPVRGRDAGHDLRDAEAPGLDLDDLAGAPFRDQDAVKGERRLLDLAEDVPLLDLVAGLADGLELPGLGPVERRHLDAAGDEVPGLRPDAVERPLDAVVDGAEEARSELDAQRPPGQRDRLARPDAGRVLVDLDVGPVFLELDDLADEAETPDLDHVVHLGAETFGRDDERPGHANDLSFLHVHPFRFTRASEPVARTAISFSMTSRWSEAVL